MSILLVCATKIVAKCIIGKAIKAVICDESFGVNYLSWAVDILGDNNGITNLDDLGIILESIIDFFC